MLANRIKELLGERIKMLREAKGLSQRELAAKMNQDSNATICDVENGNRNITIDTLENIANSLEVDVATLFKFNQSKEEMPEILKGLHIEFPQIQDVFLDIFRYCYNQGIKFEDQRDYFCLWLLMDALINEIK